MTIATSTRKSVTTGNGVKKAFPFAYKVFSTADVLVVQAVTATGVETVKTLTTDYTVALNANQESNPGGTVTMLVAPPTGTTLTLASKVVNQQPNTAATSFTPAVLNDALDRATIQIQQLDERLSRSVTLPISGSANTTLPKPTASKVLAWNSAGNGLANVDAPSVLAGKLAAASGASLVGFQAAGSGAVATTVQNKLREVVSVKDFGALGDGTGRTPADDGVDITNKVWNCYPPGSSYFSTEYSPDASITAATKAFSNTDSWDTIGIQLAVWYNNSVKIPAGRYLLTRPIQRVFGMEGMLSGDGAFITTLTYKTEKDNPVKIIRDFENGRSQAGFALLHQHQVLGGPPSYIRDMCFATTNGQIQGVGIYMQRCNQHHLDDLWITGFEYGIRQDNACNDGPFITGLVTEFNINAIHSTDSGLINISHCDFWQSALGGETYNAIVTVAGNNGNGDINVHNTSFYGFRGACVQAAGACNIAGCEVIGHLYGTPFTLGDNSIITGTKITGIYGWDAITLANNSICKGNYIYANENNEHSDININGSNNIIEGNHIYHKNKNAISDNYAIYASGGGNNLIMGNFLMGGTNATVKHGPTDIVLNNYQNGVFIRADLKNWKPVDGSGAGLKFVIVSTSCVYDKVGRQVTLSFDLTYPVTTSAVKAMIGGLPFVPDIGAFGGSINFTTYSATPLVLNSQTVGGVPYIVPFDTTGNQILNSALSGKRISGSFTYFTSAGG